MSVNHSSTRLKFLAICCSGVALLLVMVPGCRRTPDEPAPVSERLEVQPEPPSPQLQMPATPPRFFDPPDIIAPPPSTPAPLLHHAAPQLSENVADLNARFHARSTPPAERDEIIQALGRLDAPQALPTLRRIFEEEKRLELRMRVLEVVAELPAGAAPGRWELFARATEARQPLLMRLSAMQTLADSEDPRAVPFLQQLARDQNASVRENAARILKERLP